jgi:2-oxoglutarate dehydrogenase E2 component (dihydrolipoamide succinyltransferase)
MDRTARNHLTLQTMAIELKIPEVGESITEVEIGGWLKAQGEQVEKDAPIVTLESEKATVELPAPESGTITQVLKQKGEIAKVGEIIGYLEPSAVKPKTGEREPGPEPKVSQAQTTPLKVESKPQKAQTTTSSISNRNVTDSNQDAAPTPTKDQQPPRTPPPPSPTTRPTILSRARDPEREEEVVPMSPLRRKVAERLVEAQRSAALLTTFNEIDMTGVVALRKEYGEAFQDKYQVKLGFMSFFVKACIVGLKQVPAVNAEVRENDIVYHNYFDIGIAVGSGKGLVVPVLRNAQLMSFSEIEVAIRDFAQRAKENKLKVEELQGGTFTISNGGVYGSLLSTPIVNPPQSGVLGLHAIQERPVAREGAVVIRPMMYVALTYDHRIVDGREGVSFLKRVKEIIENPARMLIEV